MKLTAQQAADRIGICRAYLLRLKATGPPSADGIYDSDALDQWIAERDRRANRTRLVQLRLTQDEIDAMGAGGPATVLVRRQLRRGADAIRIVDAIQALAAEDRISITRTAAGWRLRVTPHTYVGDTLSDVVLAAMEADR
jgi:hypothetical protein